MSVNPLTNFLSVQLIEEFELSTQRQCELARRLETIETALAQSMSDTQTQILALAAATGLATVSSLRGTTTMVSTETPRLIRWLQRFSRFFCCCYLTAPRGATDDIASPDVISLQRLLEIFMHHSFRLRELIGETTGAYFEAMYNVLMDATLGDAHCTDVSARKVDLLQVFLDARAQRIFHDFTQDLLAHYAGQYVFQTDDLYTLLLKFAWPRVLQWRRASEHTIEINNVEEADAMERGFTSTLPAKKSH